ncbi:SGNH/GDSL hydrolase family protein [Leptolyngbya sp. KIOST-1]|uniref:SGNH/GDSL hydrolase family protein n=1 Tax=Leptolyngbya sp. KIOST-1 TaxID=1229172 RepID=UPI000A581352|nr:SGNH/GDSL hydrolase family protein [Leptolyngbya sp. KIOST-1]
MAFGVLGLVVAELFLRVRYGLGNPPLYVADARTGYRLAPNQTLRRRGNRIAINAYSMRGPEISLQRATDTLRVLMVGDSIVNGGWWTDQSELLSLRLQAALEPLNPANFRQVEVLNASANSWGPRNELGYVLRFGTFEAQVVLLVLNTDDLFAIAPHSYDLGRNPQYPTRRPLLALQEAIARRRSYTPSAELQALHDQRGDRVGVNLEALRQLKQVVEAADGRLAIAMTPLRRELEDGPRDYEQIARQRLTAFAQAEGLPYLDFLPQFQQTGSEPLYFDHIHLSAEGNRWVGQALAEWLALSLPLEDRSTPGQERSPDPLQDLW